VTHGPRAQGSAVFSELEYPQPRVRSGLEYVARSSTPGSLDHETVRSVTYVPRPTRNLSAAARRPVIRLAIFAM
jgi:hypothetical protein